MDIDLFPEEIKFLILNLTKKKDTVTDETELDKINKRIDELSETLKKKNQKEINETYTNIVETVDYLISYVNNVNGSVINEVLEESAESEGDISVTTEKPVLEDENRTLLDLDVLLSQLKDLKIGLSKIYDYQSEIQNVKNPVNFYFDFLVIPINKPSHQILNTGVINNNNVSVISNTPEKINTNHPAHSIPQALINNNTPKAYTPPVDVNSSEFMNKRHKVNYFASVGNYEKIYELLKDSNMKLVTYGMEDILNKPAPDGNIGTVLDQVKLICPVTDDFEFLGEDELSKQPTEIHMSSKAQEILGGVSSSNHDFIVSEDEINYDLTPEMPKANTLLKKIKNFSKF